MGSYTVVEDVGNAIVSLLRKELVPHLVEHQEDINLCSPDDNEDITVGVHLYDISQNEDLVGMGFQNRGSTRQSYPSLFLNLSYMITVQCKTDIKYRARQEQRIQGKILQVFFDTPNLPVSYLADKNINTPIQMELDKLKVEDKMKIYSVPNKAYKSTLFYRVYPVELESSKVRKVTRVEGADMGVKDQKGFGEV